MTALVVGLTTGIFAAFCLLAHAAYRDAALQRAVCVACNQTVAPVHIRALIDVEQFTAALRRVTASYATLSEAARRFDQRLQPLATIPPIKRPTRSAAFFLAASEWLDDRRTTTDRYVPKHRAPRRGA